jgi:hypothetical protein
MKTLLNLVKLALIGPALASSIVNATPTPQPLVRDNSCPSGYHSSGAYCIPSSNAKFAIERLGVCPSGYYTSGNYCVASFTNSKLAIPRINSCPSGYYSSGNYCISSK